MFHRLNFFFGIGCLLLSATAVLAQSTVSPEPRPEEAVVLSPFLVEAGDSEGYRAESSASGLPFVVSLDRTPLPIQVLTPEFIADTGSIAVEDALRFTSGVANGERNEYGSEKFVVRGFRTNSVFINGTQMNLPTDASVIERVEVLKGPSTIVYGALDPAGLVNIITKRAHFRNTTDLGLMWDEYGTARGVLDVNRVLSKSDDLQVAGRLVGTRSQEESYLPNQHRDRTIIAPALRFDSRKLGSFEISYAGQRETGATNRLQTPFHATSEPFTFADGFVPITRDFTWVTPNDLWYFDSDYFNAQWTHRFGDSTHVFLSCANSDADVDQYFFLGTGRIAPNAAGEYRASGRMTTQITHRENEVYTLKVVQELELAGTEHKLAFVARRTNDLVYQYAFQDSRDPTLGPYLIAAATGPKSVRFPGVPRTLTDPYSTFAVPILGNILTQSFDPTMNWTVGLTDYATLLSGRLNLLAGAQYNTIRGQDRDKVVPQVGALYELRPGLNAYALYSQTFAPNIRSDSTDPNSPFLPPEEGTGYEVGLKFNLAGEKVTGTLAAYEIARENVAQILAGIIGGRNIVVPSGEEKSKGIELDLLFRPVAGLDVNFAYAYTDAYVSAQEINADNPDLDGDGVSDAVGLKKEGVAKHDIRVWTRYRFGEDTPLYGLSLGGGYTWREGPIQQFGTFLQRKVLQVESPQRVDLFAQYETRIFDRPASWRVNWQNATNETYRDRRGQFVIPATISVSMNVTF